MVAKKGAQMSLYVSRSTLVYCTARNEIENVDRLRKKNTYKKQVATAALQANDITPQERGTIRTEEKKKKKKKISIKKMENVHRWSFG